MIARRYEDSPAKIGGDPIQADETSNASAIYSTAFSLPAAKELCSGRLGLCLERRVAEYAEARLRGSSPARVAEYAEARLQQLSPARVAEYAEARSADRLALQDTQERTTFAVLSRRGRSHTDPGGSLRPLAGIKNKKGRKKDPYALSRAGPQRVRRTQFQCSDGLRLAALLGGLAF